MPSFLSSLRRKSSRSSKASGRHGQVVLDGQANGQNGNGLSHRVSASTLNSSQVGSSTPSTTPATSTTEDVTTLTKNLTNGPTPLPARPQRPSVEPVKRYSMNGLSSPTSTGSNASLNKSSLLAPRVISVSDNSWVHQQVLLIFGQVGEANSRPLDGTITVNHHQGRFPATCWPVHDSYFKALVHLEPGWNRIRLDFASPKVSSNNTSVPCHASFININYLPLSHSPPLQLAIILGRDSPGTYDVPPDRMQREGNGLDLAIRKFRMAAYLWQAFTGEQMKRYGFGRRCFRFEDAWEPGTLSFQDWATNQYRTQAKVHVIRSSKTVAEIQDLERAQQYGPGTKKGELFDIALEACRDYFHPTQKHYVSCMFLDSRWDQKENTIRGHAALGGGAGDLQIGIFGSHALHSYPSSIEEVFQSFQDCTRTDTAFVANDCNESGSNWETANIGIGAHLHETGHLFGCPHQESGVMLRDYVTLNRTFICRESYSTRTKSPGQRLVLPNDECRWHKLDVLRFRFHPCFRIPIDQDNLNGDSSVQVWTVDSGQGGVIATSKSGIAWVELYPEGDDVCHYWREFPESDNQFPRQVALEEATLRALMPKEKLKSRLKIEVFSAGGGSHVIEDFSLLANQKLARVKFPDGRWGYRGSKLGYSQMEGSQPQEILLENTYISTKLLLSVKVYHGFALDGLEFIYEDATSQLFGKRGGTPTDFPLDTRKGELILGFALRAGLWIDGIQILTTLGRKSDWFGNPNGGSGHTLIPPRGYTIGGISGSCGSWIDGFSLIITR
ncbi:zinc metallo protein-like proteinase [Cucurbitaria berberidis CBS 394.84]|uniref:Zinc metallo protein-like proteinase n=1 Tax=Cucurbitaria berberidis CBS 394.84 TaxID=1168544 RepID=A0A9P4L6V1_9PLEO|nr:zinc metallo protein-like proteinase [Cucurbitaria berberidis CBS 394.84]KAF1843664.1 zinc metallo protein-like proteinase [Cucurbitaria berberidis CBS 394.84]